ncbi:MAG TPA: response regulator transcription factor, partial [Gemmatimonadales bacterium]|nr:response regulator transcription factor [Gemmatimonadales bacterium]
IAENQPVFALGLRRVLEPALEILRIVEDGASAVKMLRQAAPDLLLVGLTLPNLGGQPLIRLAHEVAPGLPILAMNATWSEEMIRECFDSGAAGFVAKTVGPDAFLSAISEALTGARNLIRLPEAPRAQERSTIRNPLLSLLTPRVRQVLDLIGLGLSGRNIAACLGITERTVEHYRAELRARLGADNPAKLYKMAIAYTASRNAVEPHRWKGRLGLTQS